LDYFIENNILDLNSKFIGIYADLNVKLVEKDSVEAPVEAPVDLVETEINILKSLENESLSTSEIAKLIGHTSKSGILKKSLKNLLNLKFIELTIPDKPNSPKQKYRITTLGINQLNN
jgi:DNA-binding HxlR family transcriptional regulator